MARMLCALLAWLLLSAPVRGDDIHVAVAANFLATAQVLAQRFEAESGHRVLLSSGSTGKLYAQILQGAPYDVFLAADSERPRLLEQGGAAVPGSRFTYALGKLVLWSRDEHLRPHGESLGDGRVRRLAIANPRTAPYGAAARQVLERLGHWQAWRDRVVRGENVGQAFQYAATANVDAAFVALAQVRQLPPDRSGSMWRVPDALYTPIEQQAVLLPDDGGQEAARGFMTFLDSPQARVLIEDSGYGVRIARGAR